MAASANKCLKKAAETTVGTNDSFVSLNDKSKQAFTKPFLQYGRRGLITVFALLKVNKNRILSRYVTDFTSKF